MIGINSVTIIGNIGSVSDVMTTTNGAKFVNLVVATTEAYYTQTKEKKTNTQWHNVVLWNNMTELHKIFSKGDLVYVEGRLNYRKKSVTDIFAEIVAKNIRVLSKKNHFNTTQNKSELDDYDFDLDDEIKYDGNDLGFTQNLKNE